MTTPKLISEALTRVHKLAQGNGGNIIQSSQIKRADRELLVRTEWLKEIIRGWYLLTRPDVSSGESSSWYANFWDFVRVYLHHHFGQDYCLSAENSLDLHTDSTIIPKQVVVIAPKGRGSVQILPFNTSLMIYADPDNIPEEKAYIRKIKVMPLPYALCKVSPTFFEKNPREAEIALRLIRNSSEITQAILKYGFKRAAGRLIGAYQFLKDDQMVQNLENDLNEFGIRIQKENPFSTEAPFISQIRVRSPCAARILSLWNFYRLQIVDRFPAPPGLPKNKKRYMAAVDELYEKDAYNSLSIEGYRVDEELIVRVQNKGWFPVLNPEDGQQKDALAARGYFETFIEVKNAVALILDGDNPGNIVEKELQKWYRKLFGPMAKAGIIREEDLFGYRKGPVYIRNSRHIPLPREALLDAMETLFECLKTEPHAGVRAVLGHYFFVFIHPYMDGNGRLGRFLMNAMLASGGYKWTIIQVKDRIEYLNALEIAGVEQDITPLTQFIAKQMNK